jgi:hypothetical protein
MPKVVIELQANTGAAIAQIQRFAAAQRDTFDALRAGNPALAESQIRISKLTETAKGSTEGFMTFDRSAKALAHGGIAELLHGIPIVGQSLAALAGSLKGLPLLLGGVVGVGVGVVAWLKNMDEASRKAVQSIEQLGEGLVASRKQTRLEVARIEAESRGETERATTLAAKLEVEKADEARNKRIKIAQEELQTRDWLFRQRTQLSEAGLREIEAAETEHKDKTYLIQVKLNADLKKLNEERTKASLEWLDKEIARMQEGVDAAQALGRARSAAAAESRIGGATRAGDPVALARAQFAQQTEALREALQNQIRLEADKLEKGLILDTEYHARRRALMETTAQRQAELAAQFARNEETALGSVDRSLRTLLDSLGPGFEDLSEQLDISEEVDKSRASFQTIQAAFEVGRLSAAQAGEAIRRVTENLLAQGATIDQIARVVPQQLQMMSGLFRNMNRDIQLTIDQTGGVQNAMNQLSPAPLLILTDGWYQAAFAAESYRLKILEIARIGPIGPPGGALGTTVVLPQQGGLSAEDRRALEEQMADDARRGLNTE